jgi:hypothetical protein
MVTWFGATCGFQSGTSSEQKNGATFGIIAPFLLNLCAVVIMQTTSRVIYAS